MRKTTGVLPCVLLVLLALPITAQTRPPFAVTVRYVSIDPKLSENGVKLDRSNGLGVAVTSYFSKELALELAASRAKSDLTASDFALGSLTFTPITAAVQYHFSNLYAGAGGAYAMFDTVRNGPDSSLFGYSSINFKDRFGWLANAGADIPFGQRWGLNVDAKYMRFNVSSTATLGDGARTEPARMRISPLALSAGLTFRF